MASVKLRMKVVDTELDSYESDKFKKKSIVVASEGEFPEHFKVDFIKDKTELVDTLIEGTWKTFHCNVRGRKVEKEGKEDMYFTSLECYKIED